MFKKRVILSEKVLPQAAKLPGTSGFFKKSPILRKSSAPGSEAARDKWLIQKKNNFLPKVLPQAAKLPGTRGLFKKNHILRKSSAPGSEAARDKLLLQKKVIF